MNAIGNVTSSAQAPSAKPPVREAALQRC